MDSLWLLFTQYSIKLRDLPLSTVTLSLHYLPKYLRSIATIKMGKTPTIVTWSERWYCYAIKANRRRIRPQNQPRNGALVTCKCKLTTAPHHDRDPSSCAMTVILALAHALYQFVKIFPKIRVTITESKWFSLLVICSKSQTSNVLLVTTEYCTWLITCLKLPLL